MGAEVINLHAGGVYGDKGLALQRFRRVFADLPESVRGRMPIISIRSMSPAAGETGQ